MELDSKFTWCIAAALVALISSTGALPVRALSVEKTANLSIVTPLRVQMPSVQLTIHPKKWWENVSTFITGIFGIKKPRDSSFHPLPTAAFNLSTDPSRTVQIPTVQFTISPPKWWTNLTSFLANLLGINTTTEPPPSVVQAELPLLTLGTAISPSLPAPELPELEPINTLETPNWGWENATASEFSPPVIGNPNCPVATAINNEVSILAPSEGSEWTVAPIIDVALCPELPTLETESSSTTVNNLQGSTISSSSTTGTPGETETVTYSTDTFSFPDETSASQEPDLSTPIQEFFTTESSLIPDSSIGTDTGNATTTQESVTKPSIMSSSPSNSTPTHIYIMDTTTVESGKPTISVEVTTEVFTVKPPSGAEANNTTQIIEFTTTSIIATEATTMENTMDQTPSEESATKAPNVTVVPATAPTVEVTDTHSDKPNTTEAINTELTLVSVLPTTTEESGITETVEMITSPPTETLAGTATTTVIDSVTVPDPFTRPFEATKVTASTTIGSKDESTDFTSDSPNTTLPFTEATPST